MKGRGCSWKWRMAMAAAVVAGTVVLGGGAVLAAGDVAINETNFPDEKFRSYVSESLLLVQA